MIAVATVKSIESRVADRGFWLQPVVPSRLSAVAGLAKGGHSEWISVGGADGT
jgi:hypothetical protein